MILTIDFGHSVVLYAGCASDYHNRFMAERHSKPPRFMPNILTLICAQYINPYLDYPFHHSHEMYVGFS